MAEPAAEIDWGGAGEPQVAAAATDASIIRASLLEHGETRNAFIDELLEVL